MVTSNVSTTVVRITQAVHLQAEINRSELACVHVHGIYSQLQELLMQNNGYIMCYVFITISQVVSCKDLCMVAHKKYRMRIPVS